MLDGIYSRHTLIKLIQIIDYKNVLCCMRCKYKKADSNENQRYLQERLNTQYWDNISLQYFVEYSR